MSLTPLPARPRLADHAVVRRYRVGREDDIWVLHDRRSGLAYRLGAREWGLISQADGTRDLDGIVLAASRRGVFARASALSELLQALHQAGLLAEGPGPMASANPRSADRPLDPLLDFSLTCEGKGSCCRFYSSVIFRPVEEAFARALLPSVLSGGDKPENAFLPVFGSSPCGASSIGLVDGRCAYLKDDGLCGLHAASGPLAKPLGCRTFPALFVDDGECVRVGPAPECACVFRSALVQSVSQTTGAFSLVDPSCRTSHDLDEGILVSELRESYQVCPGRDASCADVRAFSRALALVSPPVDVAAALLALSLALPVRGLDVALVQETFARGDARIPIEPGLLRPSFRAFARMAERRMQIFASYRSEEDLARLVMRLFFRASLLLADDERSLAMLCEAGPTASEAASEAFYLRASAHTYRFVSEERSIAEELVSRAARLLLARAFGRLADDPRLLADPAFEYPIALVEAAIRGYGLEESEDA